MPDIFYLSHIRFGEGALAELGPALAGLGVKRPLMVTDTGVRAVGLLDRVLAACPVPAAVFDGTPTNPTEAAVEAALELYRAEGCDGVIGARRRLADRPRQGRGAARHPSGPARDLRRHPGRHPEDHRRHRTRDRDPDHRRHRQRGRPRRADHADDGRKLGFIAPHLIPKAAICDPELTLGLPPRLTAATGMDAVTHCVETYLSPRYNPPAEAIALDGLARAVGAHRARDARTAPTATPAAR